MAPYYLDTWPDVIIKRGMANVAVSLRLWRETFLATGATLSSERNGNI
jgi:hypothetical protein